MAEDNLADALLVKQVIAMENLPLEVQLASDGEKAIDYIRNAEAIDDAPCPHLVLLDLNLPRKDGFEVLRELRSGGRCKAIPVLIITSSDSPADLRQAAELGARYFRKPTDYDQFLKLGGVLRQLLRDHGML